MLKSLALKLTQVMLRLLVHHPSFKLDQPWHNYPTTLPCGTGEAVLHPASCGAWHAALQEEYQYLCLAKGSDCLLNLRFEMSLLLFPAEQVDAASSARMQGSIMTFHNILQAGHLCTRELHLPRYSPATQPSCCPWRDIRLQVLSCQFIWLAVRIAKKKC